MRFAFCLVAPFILAFSHLAGAQSSISVGDYFYNELNVIVRISSIKSAGSESTVIYGSDGSKYSGDLAHMNKVQLTPVRSSDYIIFEPSDSILDRSAAPVLSVKRVTAELHNSRGEVVAYQVAGERFSNIYEPADFRVPGSGVVGAKVVPGNEVAYRVSKIKKARLEISWGTLESALHPEISTVQDMANLTSLIAEAQTRPDFARTALGRSYGPALRGLVQGRPELKDLTDVLVKGESLSATAKSAALDPKANTQTVKQSIKESVREAVESSATAR